MPHENAPPSVELWSGRIPVIGWFARHYWFVVEHDGRKDRWEVWQTRENCPTSWGYVHKNLMAPEAWIAGQSKGLVTEWSGREAHSLILRIERSPASYPWPHRYRYWPGPNSNTYVQWILTGMFRLGANAPGRLYASRHLPQ